MENLEKRRKIKGLTVRRGVNKICTASAVFKTVWKASTGLHTTGRRIVEAVALELPRRGPVVLFELLCAV